MKKKLKGLMTLEGYKISAVQLILPSVFIGILSLTLPVLTLQVYDRILPNPDSGTLPVLVCGVCVAVLLEICLRLCRAYMLGWGGAAYEHRLACKAVSHVVNSDLFEMGKDGPGEHLNRMNAISKLRDFHNGFDIVTYTELSFTVLYLGLLAYIGGPLVLVPVVVLTLFAVTSVIMGKRLNRALSQRDRTDDKRYNFLIEGLNGIHTIKAFSVEKPFLRRYEFLQDESTIANYGVTEATAGTFNAATVFGHIMLASIITIGAWLVLRGDVTSGSLIASIFLSGRILQPVQRALSLWTKYQDYQVAQTKVEKIFATPYIHRAAKENAERNGSLVLEDTGFRDMFQGVNLSIQSGETVRISGNHGCGKSTLLKIMAGLYMPDSGRVLIDGQSPQDYTSQTLMSHIGMISTHGTIFRGTIRDNLTRFGTLLEENVRPIVSMLGIETDVARLPRGFDTWMEGVEQDTVPPGLRQRIAMARILANHPRIILFDNAEHSLDREGYRQIHALLGRLKSKVAMVLVADDNNIANLADRHLFLTRDGLMEMPALGQAVNSNREIRR